MQNDNMYHIVYDELKKYLQIIKEEIKSKLLFI